MEKEANIIDSSIDLARRKLFDVRAYEDVIVRFEELVKMVKASKLEYDDVQSVIDYFVHRQPKMDKGTMEQIVCYCVRAEWKVCKREYGEGGSGSDFVDWFPPEKECLEHLVCMTHGDPEEFVEYASDASRH